MRSRISGVTSPLESAPAPSAPRTADARASDSAEVPMEMWDTAARVGASPPPVVPAAEPSHVAVIVRSKV